MDWEGARRCLGTVLLEPQLPQPPPRLEVPSCSVCWAEEKEEGEEVEEEVGPLPVRHQYKHHRQRPLLIPLFVPVVVAAVVMVVMVFR